MRRYTTSTSVNDMLFNMLLLFVALSLILFIAVVIALKKQQEEDSKVVVKAEFLITLTWPDESNDDVDIWVEDPLGNIVGFTRREQGLMHLDRDDLGYRNDVVRGKDGKVIEFLMNREIVTIRGFVEGEYVVNVYMYAKNGKESTGVSVRLDKINPFLTATEKHVVLEKGGQEKTVFRFIVDKDGNITEINELQKIIAGANEPPTYPGEYNDDVDVEEPYEWQDGESE